MWYLKCQCLFSHPLFNIRDSVTLNPSPCWRGGHVCQFGTETLWRSYPNPATGRCSSISFPGIIEVCTSETKQCLVWTHWQRYLIRKPCIHARRHWDENQEISKPLRHTGCHLVGSHLQRHLWVSLWKKPNTRTEQHLCSTIPHNTHKSCISTLVDQPVTTSNKKIRCYSWF